MAHDGGSDAREWMRYAPAKVVGMVRDVVTREPTPRALRLALFRAQVASDDELTTRVVVRCQDRDYADAFGKTLLRSAVSDESVTDGA
jgi:hypothetical protein